MIPEHPLAGGAADQGASLAAALGDRYRIERELGAGGMATVYLAEDLRHRRRVAIKVLHPELSAMLGPERFLKEIELTASLQHPHILPLFDSGRAEGLLYYVMPFVDGETLRARLERERQLPVADAVRIASETADALQYAHARGVVHRDVKPENILLQNGHALVADFGIALAVEQAGGSRLTQTGLSLGTPAYMAPEQATGDANVDGRADIYALGAVTYEMLTGQTPYAGGPAQAVLARALTERPAPLHPQRNRVPEHVEDAVLTALERLPADRFTTAAEFGRALTEDDGRVRPRGPRARRARRLLLAGGGAIALAATGFVAGLWTGTPRLPIAGFGRAWKATWDPGLEVQPALSPDGRYVAYVSNTAAGMRIYVRQVTGGRPAPLSDDSLDVETNPQWSPDGSRVLFLSNGGVFSAPSSGGPARAEMAEPPSGPVMSAVWAPDGRAIAYAVGDSIYIRDSAGRVRSLTRIPEASLCQWSPDGTRLACASENSYYSRVGNFFGNLSPSRIVVARVSDGATSIVSDSTSVNQSPVWSDDGQWLFFVSSRLGARDVYAMRIDRAGRASGDPLRLTTGLDAHTISIAGDGSRFAYDRYVATSNLWSLPFPPHGATQDAATAVTSGTQVIESVSIDGRWIYYDSDVSGVSELYRQRLPEGEPEQLTTDPSDEFSPDPSPDGRELAFHSWRSGSRDLYVMPLDGGPAQAVTSTSDVREVNPVWSPDGRALTFTLFGRPSGIWVVHRAANGRWGKPVERAASGAWATWSPDGRWIAYSSFVLGGSLMVVDADSGAPRVVLDSVASGVPVEMPHWSTDGRTIYFKSYDQKGNAEFWSIPATGGRPTLLTRFDDRRRPSFRPEWALGPDRMYFTIQDRQSDVWVMDVRNRADFP